MRSLKTIVILKFCLGKELLQEVINPIEFFASHLINWLQTNVVFYFGLPLTTIAPLQRWS